MYAIRSYYGQEKAIYLNVKEAPAPLLIPQYIFMICVMAISMFPNLLIKPLQTVIEPYFASTVRWEGYEVISALGYWNGNAVMYVTMGVRITSYNVCYTKLLRNYLQTMMVEMTGGEPVWLNEVGAEENWMVVGLEQIAVWNADIVFIVQYNADSTEAVQKIIQTDAWSSLEAVKNGQVYGYPSDYASWDLIDPRWILGLEWMTGKINPELEETVNLKQQVIDFYQKMYGLSEEQITQEIFPRLSSYNFV